MTDPSSQMSGEEPGSRPDADRDSSPAEEQLAQADRNDVEDGGRAGAVDVGADAPNDSDASPANDTDASPAADRSLAEVTPTPTPRGLDTDAQSVPEPYQPVPGVEDGARSRQVAGTTGDNELPPVSDAQHGGDLPATEPPD